MRDYFGLLAGRTLGTTAAVRPMITSRFQQPESEAGPAEAAPVLSAPHRPHAQPDSIESPPVLVPPATEPLAQARARDVEPEPEVELRATRVQEQLVPIPLPHGARVDANQEPPRPASSAPRSVPAESSDRQTPRKDLLLPRIKPEPGALSLSLPPREQAAQPRASSVDRVRVKEEESVVRVHIGRIEVRAVFPAAETPQPQRPKPAHLSLDNYLRARQGLR